jgi:UDP-glucose 4-epimerase|tara:strand:- start:380 stop:1363 length:984 start_codon:yes stop_codon:yes gene_type:complete
MIKYIITGGAGFIGSHLVEKLIKQNKKVIVLDNLSTGRLENIKRFKKKIRFIKCDISKKGNWIKEFKGKCYVFHLASLADIVPSIQNPKKYFESNVNGTLNILEACRKAKIIKLIYSASSSCYGIPKTYPTKEFEKINPMYPYALTKKMGEDLIIHWSKVFGIPFISLRLFNVYGTRSRTSGTYGAMFGVFLAQKLANHPFTIVGSGKQTRDFTYVTDVVDAFLKSSKSKISNEIFNIGSGKTISVNKITSLIKGKKVFIKKRPGEPDCTFADISKIKRYIGWVPKIDIEKGVDMLLNDIEYWKKAPVWTPKKINKITKLWFKHLKR